MSPLNISNKHCYYYSIAAFKWCSAAVIKRRINSTSIRNQSSAVLQEPFSPIAGKSPKWLSAKEAVASIKSNDKLFVHGVAATPTTLLNALCEHVKTNGLTNINLFHIHLEGPAEWTKKEFDGLIRSHCLFISANLRRAVNEGRADFVPIFLSETPNLFRKRVVDLDAALIHVSPPDSNGFCSLGTSVDCTRAAMQNARHIIAQCNPRMPRTFGDGIIHQSHIDVLVRCDDELPAAKEHQPSDEEQRIGRYIAEELVEDGATLQMGIGAIPDAVLQSLVGHQNLGIHTEMLADGVLPLIQSGVVSNALKNVHPGKIVSTFAMGSKKLYDFMHDNPSIVMGDVSWVNDTHVIRQNPRVTAINSCIEIDLSGQVVSDSIGTQMYSGVGGQMDFIRGAALCNDGLGKPIIAVQSQTRRGDSKIVPFIKEGAGVVTSRAHVHFVVTEFGVADLYSKNLRQRAAALIAVAHPIHRESLERAAFEQLRCMPSAD